MTELVNRVEATLSSAVAGPAAAGFAYSNLSGRPPGPLVSRLALVSPGVRHVRDQVAPYAAWWEESNQRALASGRPLWIVLGDSLSQGIGASAPDRGWVGRIAADPTPALHDTAVLNLSFNGARVLDVLERQLPAYATLREHHDVALVTLLIGNNDLMSPPHRKVIATTTAQLLAAVPDGTVVATQPGIQRAAGVFNDVVLEAATGRDLRVADFRIPHLRDFLGRLGRDHFHPNDRGYAQMAEVVRREI